MKILISTLFLFVSIIAFSNTSVDPIKGPLDNWNMYTDNDAKTCFIDFASIDVHLQSVVVTRTDGTLVHSEVVKDLPVDAIYELDYSKFKKGVYSVHLMYYSGETIKTLEIE